MGMIKRIYADRSSVKVTYQPESRKRVRVPVRVGKWLGLTPGQKVWVEYHEGFVVVSPKSNQSSLYSKPYTVEKDGAIRFPSSGFGLSQNEVVVSVSPMTRTSAVVV